MPKVAIVSNTLPNPAGPYGHVVEANGVVFTSGFGPQDPIYPDAFPRASQPRLSRYWTTSKLRSYSSGCPLLMS